jgi:hypothetical protein
MFPLRHGNHTQAIHRSPWVVRRCGGATCSVATVYSLHLLDMAASPNPTESPYTDRL